MTYNHILPPPTRNDAVRLGNILRRYARGGIMYGMAGVKAGLRAPVARKIITPDFKFELTGEKGIFTKSGRAKPNKSYSRPQITATGSGHKFTLQNQDTHRIYKYGNNAKSPDSFYGNVSDVLNARTPADLRKALNKARISNDSLKYITEAVVNGDFAKSQLSLQQMHIRNNAVHTYEDVVRSMPRNATQTERQMELIRQLADKNLIVENPYCKSGISYADGTEFRPGNTPIEDFLIGDGAVDFADTRNAYNEYNIGMLENLPEQYWGSPEINYRYMG